MSEPIILFDPDGREVVVHGRGPAGVMVAQQGYTWTRPELGALGAADDAPPSTADSPAAPQSPAVGDAPSPTGPRRKGHS